MTQRFVALLVFAGTVATATPIPLQACGDKFMMPPRGMTFGDMYRAPYPGSVLIVASAGPRGVVDYAKVEAMLTLAGYRVKVLRDAGQLRQALSNSQTDIVLAAFTDADAIGTVTQAARTKPALLPVLASGNKAETAACKQQYACGLKADDKPLTFLKTINSAMGDRVKTLGPKAARGH